MQQTEDFFFFSSMTSASVHRVLSFRTHCFRFSCSSETSSDHSWTSALNVSKHVIITKPGSTKLEPESTAGVTAIA